MDAAAMDSQGEGLAAIRLDVERDGYGLHGEPPMIRTHTGPRTAADALSIGVAHTLARLCFPAVVGFSQYLDFDHFGNPQPKLAHMLDKQHGLRGLGFVARTDELPGSDLDPADPVNGSRPFPLECLRQP